MNGLERGKVRLVEYDDAWPRLFQEEKERILQAIGQYVTDVQHVGSTAVPGLKAKPIIDIAIGVGRLSQAKEWLHRLEATGCEFREHSSEPDNLLFVKGNPRTHHLHVVEHGGAEWQGYLRFRDRLRQDDGLAKEYQELKERLARTYPEDRESYTEGKAAFIRSVIGADKVGVP